MNNKPPCFYKYVTMEGAKQITSTLSRQWSSPSAFNDPFDSQFDCGFPFTFEEFSEKFLAFLEGLVFCKNQPVGDMQKPLFKLIHDTWSQNNQNTRLELMAYFRNTITGLFSGFYETQAQVSSAWLEQFLQLRILCLTDDHTNLLMWSHYCKHHTGAVIRLGCPPGRDSLLAAAQPVKYTDTAPFIATLPEWMRHLVGQENINYDKHLEKLVTTKSTAWAYEKEWRVVNMTGHNEREIYMYDKFWPEDIQAIYFGCNANQGEIEKTIAVMSPQLSHVEIHCAKRKKWEFGLDFERIK